MTKTIASKRGILFIGILFVGIALLANSLLRNVKLDLTADRLYTISDGTENILEGLKEPVNLYLFFSERTATPIPDIKNYGQRVHDFLDELAARSGGKLKIKVIDPQPFSEEEDRATELGITGTQVGPGGEKLYLGLAGTNSTDGKEAIPFLDPRQDEQLEYDVAKLVYKLSGAKKPVIGWLSSLPMQGDFDMQTGRPRPPWVVYGQLEQLYTVKNLEPTLTSIDADIDELVLVHPKDLPPAALYAIDQFAMRGGHVLAFVDPLAQADASGNDPNNPMAQFQADKSSHLEPLLASWGIDFNAGEVVGDLERGLVVSMTENGPPSQHIAVLGFDAASLAKDPITTRLDSINMATAGSLKPLKSDKDGAHGKLEFEPLIHTSKQAGVLPTQRLLMLNDPSALRDGFKPTGELVVAARVSGTATSAFAAGPPAGVQAAPDALKASAKPLNVVVIADTDLLSDFMWVQTRNFFGQMVSQPFANNGELVWNAMDNLAGSADLISIRGRATYSRPFDRVEALRRNADAQFHSKEQQLEDELAKTEEALSKLQTSKPGASETLLSADQAQEIERFQQEKLRIRKELRAVKAGLETDIKALGMRMKVINILLVPLLFTGLALLVGAWHRRRRHAIAMLRKGGPA
jgi:ABC-type uncharacterized transport system involved in gliding motility auxiliary subunit